ncbi:MAG: ABC transporter ATP-binding protein [Candidatus Zixiibacteriota bacterium]|nr:MAG: ABC transporter ATP-binding protein [candidate division Zixibacteria bacterium]
MRNKSDSSDIAVSVRNMTKKFDGFTAVDNISFDVRRGEIFGFLGPNGAGKSTTIRILCGIIDITSGEGLIDGHSILKDQDKIKRITGYMSQKFSLYEDLTPYENLEFYGGVYGLDSRTRRSRIEWALNMSDLAERSDDLTSDLPVGYKQRLALGASLLHEPSILFLDEPTAGVDPSSRRSFWDLIYRQAQSGVTVFVTTHYMDEAEHCDRIAFIDSGKLIRLDSPGTLKRADLREDIIEIMADDWMKAFNALREKKESFGEVSLFGTRIHLRFTGDDFGDIESYLIGNNIHVESIRPVPPSLEDVFVALLNPYKNTEASS